MQDQSEKTFAADDQPGRTRRDDAPERFRKQGGSVDFSGSSGVLFEQAMAQTRMAICLSDPAQPDCPIVFVNRAFLELTGYREDEVLGRNCRFLQGPGSDRAVVNKMREAITNEDVVIVELLNYRKSGEAFWNALHLGPIYHDDGTLRYIFGSQWDVTDVHAARADEKHARTMEREISHRMKNMFAVIASIVTMTGKLDGSEGMAARISERIRSLGRAHEAMLDISFSSGPTDPNRLFADLLAPYAPQGAGSLELSGGALPMDSNTISVLALVLHELAINAVKYGAFSVPEGRLEVSWSLQDDPAGSEQLLTLHWRESNGPRIETAPTIEGAGTGIMTRMLQMCEGSIEFDWDDSGLHAQLRFPISV